jgi:hypothetical protein
MCEDVLPVNLVVEQVEAVCNGPQNLDTKMAFS